MARLARRKRRAGRSNRQSDHANQNKSAEPPPDSERVESGGNRQNGAAAVSSPFPVLRTGWRTQLSALSTKRRSVSRCPVQYCIVLAAYDDGGAGCGSYSGRLRPYLWRSASLQEPLGPGARAAFTRLPIIAKDKTESSRKEHSRFQIRGLRAYRLRPASINKSTYRGVNEL